MDITTGTGASSWSPRRLSLTDNQGVELGPEVISAQITYGPLGACQGAALNLARMPPSWDGTARSRLVRLKLEDAQGTGYVFAGVLDQARAQPGELSPVQFLPPHRIWVDVPGAGGTWPGITAGQRNFGIWGPYNAAHETLQSGLEKALEPYPNSEFGVGPDLFAVLGRPENATALEYTIDSRAVDLNGLGVVVPPYTTHAVFDPGDGWQKYTYQRWDVPVFAERRTGQATANPAIVTVQGSPGFHFNRSFTWGSQTVPAPTFDGVSRNILRQMAIYRVYLPSPSGTAKSKRYSLTFPYRVSSLPKGQISTLSVQTAEVGGQGVSEVKIEFDDTSLGLEKGVTLEFPADLVARGAAIDILVAVGTYKTTGNDESSMDITLYQPKSVLEYETPNVNAVQMPSGWNMPYQAEAGYSFRLPGWHVPPLLVRGLPGGRSQYAAGSTVTWHKGEASSTITTAAWPYEGQKR